MRTADPSRRLRSDAARNHQALLDAADRLFATSGLSVTLDDIAAEAGLNVATAYRHFANKQELLAVFLQQQIDRAVVLAEQAAASTDPWDGLAGFLARTMELMAANRALHDVFVPGHGEWLEQMAGRIEPVLDRLLRRGQAAGAVRKGLKPGDLGVVLQMLATLDDIPATDPDRLRQRYLTIVLDGLRPAGTPLAGSPPTPAELFRAKASRRAGR
jgi:AcrR family transcriptional regulator